MDDRAPEELGNRIRIELALKLYGEGIATFGEARRISGLSKWDFLEELGRRGIPIRYTIDQLEEDIKTAEVLAKKRRGRDGEK